MSTSINIAFVKQFEANVLHLAQQKGSRLRNTVRTKTGVVGKSTHFERLASGAMFQRTSRHQDTHLGNLAHTRRRATLYSYERGELVDAEDDIRTLIDPDNEYAIALANAAGRQFDDIIIAAMEGNATAVDADDAGSNVALPSAQKIAHGSTGLTLAKAISAKETLDAAEVDEDDRYFVYTAAQLGDALAVEQMTSADYNTIKALVNGDIDTYLGFKWIRSERLTTTSSVTYCYAYQKRSMGLAIGMDISSSFDKRADKSNSTQVLVKMTAGAVRVEDEAVVQVGCYEA